MRAAFEENFAARGDIGASFAATVEGEPAIDLHGGFLDTERSRAWREETLVCVFSSTKAALALCALWLADGRGLDLDAPVKRYWPEFLASEVTTRQCLAHTAGLPGWEEPRETADLYDFEKCAAALARQAPWWRPGGEWHYHALTQGFLVGEIIRRIDGRPVGRLLAEEFAGPLGADLFIGAGPDLDRRIGPIIPGLAGPPPPSPPEGSIEARMAANPPFSMETALEIPFRRAEIPAANGFGAARALALLMAPLACGGEARGRRFLSAAGAARALDPAWRGTDPASGLPFVFGTGFALALGPISFGSGACGFWGGAGGSLAGFDAGRRVSFAYVPNRMGNWPFGDPRNMSLVSALYRGLEAV
ncbi:MAG: serine hydrolase domain-containing protein [Caulobacteraceae bacterium]